MKTFFLLCQKDFRYFSRSQGNTISAFGFALLLTLVASFAFRQVGYSQRELAEVTPGILWLIFLFSGTIALRNGFSYEVENDALRGVIFSSVDSSIFYLSKCVSNFVFLAFLQVFILLMHGVLFGVEYFEVFFELLCISLLGGCSFVSLGTLFSAIAANLPGREVLLPLMLFPLSIPPVAGSVFLMRQQLLGSEPVFQGFWFMLLLGSALLSLVLSWALFDFVVKE